MSERPCPGCGVGEYYDHELGRFCNLCGLTADIETWNRLSSQIAHIARLEADNARLRGALREMADAANMVEFWHGSDALDVATARARAALEEARDAE